MTQHIQLENAEQEYLLSGEGNSETLLFVHGLGANLSQFDAQQQALSKKFKVLSVNLRGHGNTQLLRVSNPSDFELSKMANDIVELLKKLDIKSVHYIGNSMGGNVGFELLKAHPHVLKTLTTFGTTGQLKTASFVFKLMRFMHKKMSPNFRGNLSKLAGQTKAAKAKIKAMMTQVDRQTILAILPVLSNFDYLDTIKQSKTPCMIIKGGKDKGINKTIGSTITTFEKRGNFKLIEMEKAGHFANLDNPELFTQLISEYISVDATQTTGTVQ